MSKYFCFDHVTDRYEDVIFRKRGDHGAYTVYLGERIIGIISPIWKSWTAVSSAQGTDLQGMRLVNGFRTRMDAMEYLLQVGVRKPTREDLISFSQGGWPLRIQIELTEEHLQDLQKLAEKVGLGDELPSRLA